MGKSLHRIIADVKWKVKPYLPSAVWTILRTGWFSLQTAWIILRGGWIFRPIMKHFWKPKKLVLGDTNRRFVCWGWETVDIANADYNVNFRNDDIPFPDKSCSIVHTSHMIEHLPDESASHLFSEVYRVLRPGGTFRIVCPDLDKLIQAYKENDLAFFLTPLAPSPKEGIGGGKESLLLHNNLVRTLACYADGKGPIVEKEVVDKKFKEYDKYEFAKWCTSLLDVQNRLGEDQAWGHINAYDFSKLKKMLEEAGFANVVRSSRGQSRIKELRKSRLDRKRSEWISLYVEAIKGS